MRFVLAALLTFLSITAAAETLQGVVVEDHTSNPLPSVEVRVYRTGVRQLAADLETDEAGRFLAEGLPAGDYRLEVSKPNFVNASVRLPALRSGLVIRLVHCGVITGQVLDAQGQTVAGASVYAIPKPADGGALRPFDALSHGNYSQVNARGQYRLHSLAPGEYAVAVTYGSSTSLFGSSGGGAVRAGLGSGAQFFPNNARPQFFAVSGGEEYHADFAVLPGSLFNLSGKMDLPAPQTRFWLALTTDEQPALATAVTDTKSDGTFRFEGIAPGSYRLTASGPVGGWGGKGILRDAPFFGRTQVGVGGANVDGVAIAVQKGRPVSFILRSDPQSAAGACPSTAHLTLRATEDWATQIDRDAEINTQKEQTIDQVAPARFQMVLSGLGETCYQPGGTILDLSTEFDGKPVAVPVAAAGSIRGKLIGTSRPGDFAVALVSGDPSAPAQPVQVIFPDPDGRFSFGRLRPGVYRIAAQPTGSGSKTRWVSDRSRMIEIRIAGGSPTEMELPAPPANPNQ